MPMRGELPMPAARFGERFAAPPSARSRPWFRLIAEFKTVDFLAVFYFCVLGLVLSAAFIQLFPNYGDMASTLELFP